MARPRLVRNQESKSRGEPFSLTLAFRCAGAGVLHACKTQRNMIIHGAVAVLALIACAVLRVELAGWLAVIICIMVVFVAECFNTAMEAVVDLVTSEYAELARIAKDCAAGAVACAAVGSVIVGCVVYGTALAALMGW